MLLPLIGVSQEVKFKVLPYIDGTTSIKDGQIELGPEFGWDKAGNSFTTRSTIRLPLTTKSENMSQIDRFSSTWRGLLSIQYTKDNTKATGIISRNSIGVQIEYGYNEFKYYPTGKKDIHVKKVGNSYAFELKYIGLYTKGASKAMQLSPQFRLRYSSDWKSASEVGVVNPSNSNGVITTSNMVIDAPRVKPMFSPAFSLQIYSGKGSFTYSPTMYYDFIGKTGARNPFNNISRLRIESWVFFFPLFKDNPNIRIGITPFISIRTAGMDDYNLVEYGSLISVKFGTTFLQFF